MLLIYSVQSVCVSGVYCSATVKHTSTAIAFKITTISTVYYYIYHIAVVKSTFQRRKKADQILHQLYYGYLKFTCRVTVSEQ